MQRRAPPVAWLVLCAVCTCGVRAASVSQPASRAALPLGPVPGQLYAESRPIASLDTRRTVLDSRFSIIDGEEMPPINPPPSPPFAAP